ncbi:MAG: tetratricopeptide repeat protein [Chloroflexota bacterium]
MAYQEEEKTRLRRQSSKQAITLAMEGRWREAVVANQSLLENFPNDIDAYNRLGRAFTELGQYSSAKEAYQKAIELDPYNVIAKKNLSRLTYLEKEKKAGAGIVVHKVEPQQFIEEVGKAGVVNLYRLAPPEMLARTVAGDRINLKVKKANLVAENSKGEYLGLVEPKHGQRLIRLIEGGNKYETAIVSANEDGVSVIVREVYQHPSQAGRLSFPVRTGSLRRYVPERILRRELEQEEALSGEPTYTVVGGGETQILPEEPVEIEGEIEDEDWGS